MNTTPDTPPLDLDELRRLTDAATPGPWQAQGPWLTAGSDSLLDDNAGGNGCCGRDEDAVFIAHARTALPQLLDLLDDDRHNDTSRLEGQCDRLAIDLEQAQRRIHEYEDTIRVLKADLAEARRTTPTPTLPLGHLLQYAGCASDLVNLARQLPGDLHPSADNLRLCMYRTYSEDYDQAYTDFLALCDTVGYGGWFTESFDAGLVALSKQLTFSVEIVAILPLVRSTTGGVDEETSIPDRTWTRTPVTTESGAA